MWNSNQIRNPKFRMTTSALNILDEYKPARGLYKNGIAIKYSRLGPKQKNAPRATFVVRVWCWNPTP